jgi:hypothetical protein
MAKRLTVIFVFSMIVLLVFAGVVFATTKNAAKSGKQPIPERRYLRGDEPAAVYTPSNKYPTPSSVTPVLECEDAWPEMEEYPGEYVLEFDQIGVTWYEYQKNNSMGRMMSVTPTGYRHFSWMYAMDAYAQPGDVRYVYGTSKPPVGSVLSPGIVDGGAGASAGYSNQDHLQGGISVVAFHRTAGDPIPDAMIAMEDAPGTTMFTRFWDMPDSIVGGTDVGEWPKLAIKYDPVDGKDYIHYVETEFNTTPQRQPYMRAYLTDANTMVIQVPKPGAPADTYTRTSNTIYSPFGAVYEFSVSCDVSAIPVCSPISRRVALTCMPPACGTDCQSLNDVAFGESMVSGNDWMLAGNYPPALYNVTNYGCTYPSEQAVYDHSATYDYSDSLHLIWITVGYPEPGYWEPGNVKLWHWSKEANGGVPTMITSKITDEPVPTAFNVNIGKMSISARDPIYDESGKSSANLYAIWTQFNEGDLSEAGFTNGELYGTTSGDGGLTWGNIYNLTQTNTDGCKWDCVGEHWSSLAANMYQGDLHIQYVCDKEAGASIQDNTRWMENPMFYLRLKSWSVGERCEGSYTRVDPGSFHQPPVKITPGGSRILTLKIINVGNVEMPYTAVPSTSTPDCVSGAYTGTLPILGQTNLTFTVSGAGACDGTFFMNGIELTMCDVTVTIPVHAISAEDYYECPTDPVTKDTIETSALMVYANANSLEWAKDLTISDPDLQVVFFQGGSYVATTIGGEKVVGRFYGDNDWRSGARDKLYYDECDYEDPDPDCKIMYTKNIFILPPADPPDYTIYTTWSWWEWSKVIKVCELPDFKKIIIKYIRVKRHDPPTWWPNSPVFAGYPDTYIGMMMDIDCPFDVVSGEENAQSIGGYDDVNHIAWQQGSYDPEGDDPHPEYANYYAGLALANPLSSAPVTPYGAHVIKNNYYLYPQSPWGWLDEEFYDLAATAGNSVQDPDSVVDRSVVMTAVHIPAGTDANADYSFTVIEAATPNGLAELQSLVAEGRALVVDEVTHGIPIICGDANGKDGVNMGDAIYLLNYLFKGEAAPLCPMNRADVNSKDGVNMGDAIYLLNYLFKGEAAPNCPGLFF